MGKAKLNIPMCAALVLLFLTMLSIHLTSGLYARYTAAAEAGDSARVAKFDVSAVVDEAITLDCTEGDMTAECKIAVTNDSEVAVSYSVTIVFNEVLNGTDLIVKLDDQYMSTSDNRTFTVSNVGTLEPNAGALNPNSHTLFLELQHWPAVTRHVEGKKAAKWDLGFKVRIDAQQID